MEKTKIQISVYEYYTINEEIIYEAQVGSIEEFLALTYSFGNRVKYKKLTDKNWYYGRTMIKRLFKKQLEGKRPTIKFVTTNNLDKVFEERRRKEEEKERQQAEILRQEQLAFDRWRRENPVFTIEQLDSLTPDILKARLRDLHEKNKISRKSDFNYYDGAFEDSFDEIYYIEQLLLKKAI